MLDVGSLLSDDHLSYVGVTRDGDVLGLGDTDIAGVANTVSAVDLMVLECGFAVVAADGGVFTFGGAPFLGSLGGLILAAPIVAAAPTPSGAGYWLFGADGGVFTFGDAGFHGSLGAIDIGVPIVDAAASPTGDGYWMVTADGAVFSFGDAVSLGSIRSTADIVAINAFERGYALTRRDGSTLSLGTTLRSWDTPGTAARSAIVDASGPVVVSGGGEVIRLQDGRRLKTPVGVVAAAPTPATICS